MKFGVVVFPGSNCDEDALHAAKDVFDVTYETLGLGDCPAGERAARNNALKRFGVGSADEPDQLTRDELHVVAATAEQARILVDAADARSMTVLVDVQ